MKNEELCCAVIFVWKFFIPNYSLKSEQAIIKIIIFVI